MIKVSCLICSYEGSPYLGKTINSLYDQFPHKEFELEVLTDIEKVQSGLHNTVNRYMKLYKKSTGDIIIKSDDDVRYYPKFFEACYHALTNDKKIGYVGPISHLLMKQLEIRHACSDKLPVYPQQIGPFYREEPVISGMCWVMNRSLWDICPYNNIRGINLDAEFAKMVRQANLMPVVIVGGLVSHLSSVPESDGTYRFKGVKTDVPGKHPSDEFRAKHPEFNFKIF